MATVNTDFRRGSRGGESVRRVREFLIAEIERGAVDVGGKLPSRSEVAKKCNVALSTVTAALKELGSQGLVEFIPGKGIYLSKQPGHSVSTLTIGMIGWFASHPESALLPCDDFWQATFLSLTAEAQARDIALVLIPKTEREPLQLDRITSYRLDAMISHCIEIRPQTVVALRRRGIPFLMGDRHIEHTGVSYVDYDTVGDMGRVVEMFWSRGHRSMACITVRPNTSATAEKWYKSFAWALHERGWAGNSRAYWRALDLPRSEMTSARLGEMGRREAEALFDLPDPPTAIYCRRVSIAEAAAEMARERGLSVGRDISILTEAARAEDTRFSVLAQPYAERARVWLDAAARIVNDPFELRQVVLPKEFVDKGTVSMRPNIQEGGPV